MLLVTTSHSLGLLEPQTGNFQRIETGQGLYYGMAVRHGLLYVAARNRLVSDTGSKADERGHIRVFDAQLHHIDTLTAPFPLRDIHQIAWIGNELYVTCSHDNMVAIYTPQRGWVTWYPLGEPETVERDINHFNSLKHLSKGRLAVLAHNLHQPSEIHLYGLPEKKRLSCVPMGHQAHNIACHRGRILTCSSAEGCLINTRGERVHTGGFPRGLAHEKGLWYVGISQLAERAQRDISTGRVQIYDRRWHLHASLELPHEGLILDILPLAHLTNSMSKTWNMRNAIARNFCFF